MTDLRHHGDREVGAGLLDFAVNVHEAPVPPWLSSALADSLADLARYPDPAPATAALAAHHHRLVDEVLPTAGAAEAFTLVARLRSWRRPVVVHPQFTEPDVALQAAGHAPTHVVLDGDFRLAAARVPDDADLVVVGNPTNPTGVRHPAAEVLALRRPGRLLVVDEAFCDDGRESVATAPDGVLVVRSLTKLWAVPGLRAGYVLGPAPVVAALRRLQPPWSVSTPALATMVATTTDTAAGEARRRVADVRRWRAHLLAGLADAGVPHVAGDPTTPFVLARPGAGVHARLRAAGIAVRRGDTFPGLDDAWVRVAVRDEARTDLLLAELARPPLPGPRCPVSPGSPRLHAPSAEEAGEIPARSRHCDTAPSTTAVESDPTPGSPPHRSGRSHPAGGTMALATPATPHALSTGPVALPVIGLRELAPWLVLAVLATVSVLFFIGSEQGATSVLAGTAVHEFVHDARHLLGYPCH